MTMTLEHHLRGMMMMTMIMMMIAVSHHWLKRHLVAFPSIHAFYSGSRDMMVGGDPET